MEQCAASALVTDSTLSADISASAKNFCVRHKFLHLVHTKGPCQRSVTALGDCNMYVGLLWWIWKRISFQIVIKSRWDDESCPWFPVAVVVYWVSFRGTTSKLEEQEKKTGATSWEHYYSTTGEKGIFSEMESLWPQQRNMFLCQSCKWHKATIHFRRWMHSFPAELHLN